MVVRSKMGLPHCGPTICLPLLNWSALNSNYIFIIQETLRVWTLHDLLQFPFTGVPVPSLVGHIHLIWHLLQMHTPFHTTEATQYHAHRQGKAREDLTEGFWDRIPQSSVLLWASPWPGLAPRGPHPQAGPWGTWPLVLLLCGFVRSSGFL